MLNFSNYYYLVIALQAFCLYHAYRSHTQQKWYWIIIFVPVVGSLIYLYENFYNRRNMDSLAEGVRSLVFSNYEVGKLEKEVKSTAYVYFSTASMASKMCSSRALSPSLAAYR